MVLFATFNPSWSVLEHIWEQARNTLYNINKAKLIKENYAMARQLDILLGVGVGGELIPDMNSKTHGGHA